MDTVERKMNDRSSHARLSDIPRIATLTVGLLLIGGFVMWYQRAEQPAETAGPTTQSPQAGGREQPSDEDEYAPARRRMVSRDLAGRNITDKRVLEAMGRVPRHRFVPKEMVDQAYADHPLPIGHGQTISQPYIVALMSQLAGCEPESRALDIGTGSGYQAAVLAELCKDVYSIEIVRPLAEAARARLAKLGHENVEVRAGDGYRGWPEHAPFDVIIVAAAPEEVPQPLIDQLAPGGRLIIPVGRFFQKLVLIEKRADGTINRKSVTAVAFVPMTGEARSDSAE